MWGKKRGEERKILNKRDEFSIFISHFPSNAPPDGVLRWLSLKVEEKFGEQLNYSNKILLADGITCSVGSEKEFEQALSINGTKIIDKEIWIISLPGNLTFLAQTISTIFSNCLSVEGILDLSYLPTKFLNCNANPENVDFTSRWFVEYLFYRLGVESEKRELNVSKIILSGNNLTSVKRWKKFFIFLPFLREIDLNGNCLEEEPDAVDTNITFIANGSLQVRTTNWSVLPRSTSLVKSKWKTSSLWKNEAVDKWNDIYYINDSGSQNSWGVTTSYQTSWGSATTAPVQNSWNPSTSTNQNSWNTSTSTNQNSWSPSTSTNQNSWNTSTSTNQNSWNTSSSTNQNSWNTSTSTNQNSWNTSTSTDQISNSTNAAIPITDPKMMPDAVNDDAFPDVTANITFV
jgi:hypothetical protein